MWGKAATGIHLASGGDLPVWEVEPGTLGAPGESLGLLGVRWGYSPLFHRHVVCQPSWPFSLHLASYPCCAPNQ